MSYSTSKSRLASKVVSVALAVTTFVWLVGVPSAGAVTIAELLAQIQLLQGQLTALQAASGGAAACTFARSLTVGARGDDVKCLQDYLTSTGHFSFSGGSTGFFGSVTRAAVAAWQAANGVSPAAGFFGSISRAKYTSLAGGPTPPPPPGTPPVGGTGLTVSLASDTAAAGLFGENFASRPFTKINFTASADGDITVSSVTVQRTGQAQDGAFNGIILLDENNLRVGTAKTLNSNHQVVLNDAFTVKAGTTRGMTIAGDSDSDQDAFAGQVATLSLVAVNAGSATVNGTLPIVGNGMTVNSTLAVGAVTLSRGSRDPNVNVTKEVGVTAYIFSSLKLTAGSNEDLLVKSIRWNQSGSAAIGDLANLKTYIDGTSDSYDHTVSADGKYFTAVLGSGLKIVKGDSKEIYVKGDITGGSGRGVDFDLYRYADIQVRGLTYSYDILPTATEVSTAQADDSDFRAGQPNYSGREVTISNGTMNVTKATSVAAQNIAINLSGQVLGGLDVEVKGEAITVASMKFDLSIIASAATGGTLDTNDVTSITLVNAAGNVVAGPVDGAAGGNNAISFSDTVTFPIGTGTYTLKGKLGTDVSNNDTLAASTTPGTDWTTVRGVVTGNSITPVPSSAVTSSTMTVKGAALTVTVSPTPAAQNVVAGVSAFTFANYVFDATASGEDIRTTSILPQFTGTANTADDLTNCQLFDGLTPVNTGSNIVNPADSTASGGEVTFTLDTGLVTPKGTVKTIALKCNVRANTDGTAGTDTYAWGLENAAANVVSTGLTSGQAVTESITTNAGQNMTLRAGGTLAVALDSSSPALKFVQAGAVDQTLAVLRVNGSFENVRLDRVGLQIATSTVSTDAMASNTPSDLSKVTLWNGAKKIGEATFTTSDYATSTFTTQFGAAEADYTVIKDEQILITVKGDIGTVGTITNAFPGHLILVNYDASSADDEANTGLKGTGLASGNAIYGAGSDSASNGARISKAVPTVERVALTTTKFSNVSGQTLYRFKIVSPAATNGLSLYKFTFSVSTSVSGYLQELPGDGDTDPDVSSFRVDTFQVFCYSDVNFTVPACGSFDNSGLLNSGSIADSSTIASSTAASNEHLVSITFNPTDSTGGSTAEAIVIPAGETRYFAVKATVTGASSTPSIIAKMQGDAQFASLNNSANDLTGDTGNDMTTTGDSYSTGRYVFATTASIVDNWDDDDFIWSGNSTNTAMSINTYDWFNGFLVAGLSNTDGGITETLTLTQ